VSILCTFLGCRWHRVVNVSGPAIVYTESEPLGQRDAEYGLYQCFRCKTISVGAVRGPEQAAYDSKAHAAAHSGF
jgi:hypothetical protein